LLIVSLSFGSSAVAAAEDPPRTIGEIKLFQILTVT